MLDLAESFSASGACSRERPGPIAAVKTCLQIRTSHVLMQKAGVEAVARPDGIDRHHISRRTGEAFCRRAGPSRLGCQPSPPAMVRAEIASQQPRSGLRCLPLCMPHVHSGRNTSTFRKTSRRSSHRSSGSSLVSRDIVRPFDFMN